MFMSRKARLVVVVALLQATLAVNGVFANELEGRAVLPATTFAPGPTSGQYLNEESINGQTLPFVDQQPVQGFSAVLDNGDGGFDVMSDNGFGAIENSADYHLRVYTIYPDFETRDNGSGQVSVQGFIELHDPDKRIPFSIVNEFTERRVLTGADFDPESMQRVADGSLWFGDEFGPFLLHTDPNGRVLEAPFALPDLDKRQQNLEIRAPQNPLNEEGAALRVMNAVRAHALKNGNRRAPVISPWEVMLADDNPATFAATREAPPSGSGLEPASSEIFDIASLQAAGFPVVPYTVNDTARMRELIDLGVDGLISDRPDLLRETLEQLAATGGATGFIDAEGLIDGDRFDAQGHRGARGLRPENTLPAMEAALDYLMSTLETDNGVTADGVPVLSHDPVLQSDKCRRADGARYAAANEVLIKDLTGEQLQTQFVCDRLLTDFPDQSNDLALSPVAAAFADTQALPHPYVMPTLRQLFEFVNFYVDYYRAGAGANHPDALRRWRNAEKVRFNIETKINPRPEFASRTIDAENFTQAVANVIVAHGMQARADIQSFDFRTLLIAQKRFPDIRTVYLFGDFPLFDDPTITGSDDGTNLQPDASGNTPWLAGLTWPYRVTARDQPLRAQTSGGFEGMALTTDGESLLPLLEKPLTGDDEKTLVIHAFDLASKTYTGERYAYLLDPRGEAIGDFVMFSNTRGLVIERDNTQGDLDGFKAIYEVTLGESNDAVGKQLRVDLLNIDDPRRISEPGNPGDVGLGRRFAFPFVTIEDVVLLGPNRIGVLNDNNFPSSIGRHVGTGAPDDNEFIVIKLRERLSDARR